MLFRSIAAHSEWNYEGSNACFELEEFMLDCEVDALTHEVNPLTIEVDPRTPKVDPWTFAAAERLTGTSETTPQPSANQHPQQSGATANTADTTAAAHRSPTGSDAVVPLESSVIVVDFDAVTSPSTFPKSLKQIKLRERLANWTESVRRCFKRLSFRRRSTINKNTV